MTRNKPFNGGYNYRGAPQAYYEQPQAEQEQPQYPHYNASQGEMYNQSAPGYTYQQPVIGGGEHGLAQPYYNSNDPSYQQSYQTQRPPYSGEQDQYSAPSPYQQPAQLPDGGQSQYGAPSPYQQPALPSYGEQQSNESATAGQQHCSDYPPNDGGPEVDAFKSHFDQPNAAPYEEKTDIHARPATHGESAAYSSPGAQEEDRGLMGALGGAAAGGFAGHRMGRHGIIGALGGALAGSLLEDRYKKHHNEQKLEQQHSWAQQQMDTGSVEHGHAGPEGNFHASAQGMRLEEEQFLVAECKAVDGRRHWSRLDLSDCLINNNGHLAWSRGGGFKASARNVRLSDNGQTLEAEVKDVEGRWNPVRIWLSEKISNDNGRLYMV